MKSYLAFTKKEFMEFTRTYKLLIMFAVFLILGMMNPLTAKLTPALLENFMPEGIEISLGEPTAFDSWLQFYKNVPQMGLIVMVLLFSSLISGELSKGTLVNMVTKGLKRQTIILSKFTMSVIMWSFAYWLCFFVSWGYTAYFWNGDMLSNVIFSGFCLWLFGSLLISFVLFAGVLTSSNYGSLLLTGFFVVFLYLLKLIPKIKKFNPIVLISENLELLTDSSALNDFTISIIFSLLLIFIFIFSSVFIFNKKQL